MKLRDLIEDLPQKILYGNPDVDIEDITFDSRVVRPGSLFVAIKGWDADGHHFIGDAARNGASAIVSQNADGNSSLPLVFVPDSRAALALLASAFYGYPARELCVIGVTGTDGKTTTTNLIGSMFKAAGRQVGTLSTIKAEYGGRTLDTGLHTTTPNPIDVQRYLRDMVGAGVNYAVLESTSHALDQDRVLGCEFDVAVVTNVAPEHLDYHRSYGRYLAAKGRLFASLARSRRKPGIEKVSVTNLDDVSYGYLRTFAADVPLTYGIHSEADVTAGNIDLDPSGARFRIVTRTSAYELRSPLPGLYNVYNTLAATTVATALGLETTAIRRGAAEVGTMTGRWERIATGEDFDVIVDFAHTPQSLEQALSLARARARGRVIVVFGCAGQRDRFKRPLMGEIAGRLADITVLTAEDPRNEDLAEITRQIAEGCKRAGRQPGRDYFEVSDRAEAISFAIKRATSNDLVLITGKGHERSMCFGDVEIPWSEHEAVAKALRERHSAQHLERN